MEWQKKDLQYSYPSSIFSFTTFRDNLLFRSADEIFALDEKSLQRSWSVPLPEDHSFGQKRAVVSENAYIFLAHKNQEADKSFLFAIHPETGKPLWEYQVSWGLTAANAFFKTWKNFLVFFEKEQLYILDDRTGQLQIKESLPRPDASGLGDKDPEAGFVLDDRIFYVSAEKKLIQVKLDKRAISAGFGQVENSYSLTHDGQFLYVLHYGLTDKLQMVSKVDAQSLQILSSYSTKDVLNIWDLKALPERNIVLATIKTDASARGMVALDVDQNVKNWEFGMKDDIYISQILLVKNKLIVNYYEGDVMRVVQMDSENGKVETTIFEYAKGAFSGFIASINGDLVISDGKVIHIFHYS